MNSLPSHSSEPSRWQKLGQSTQFKTPVFDLDHARYLHPERGTERNFVVINAPDWVNVIALTPDHRLVLVRQFRYGTNEFSLEIPGGVIDAGEDPVAAGIRELREETGYTGGPVKILGSVHPNPAIQSNRAHFVFVEQAIKTQGLEWDPDEEIQVIAEPVERVFELAHAGGITHALVLSALMLFEPHWKAAGCRA